MALLLTRWLVACIRNWDREWGSHYAHQKSGSRGSACIAHRPPPRARRCCAVPVSVDHSGCLRLCCCSAAVSAGRARSGGSGTVADPALRRARIGLLHLPLYLLLCATRRHRDASRPRSARQHCSVCSARWAAPGALQAQQSGQSSGCRPRVAVAGGLLARQQIAFASRAVLSRGSAGGRSAGSDKNLAGCDIRNSCFKYRVPSGTAATRASKAGHNIKPQRRYVKLLLKFQIICFIIYSLYMFECSGQRAPD